MVKVIGLCGGSGSGKGTVCAVLLERGIPTIDTDAVYRELTASDSECMQELVAEFGEGVAFGDGSLNRPLLRDIVFSGDGASQRLSRLNEITHRHILGEARRRIAEYARGGTAAVTVDAPVLYESGFDRECDAVVAVLADREVRIQRIVARDGISREAAQRRIDSQISDEELRRRADYIIVNDGDESILRERAMAVAEEILNL